MTRGVTLRRGINYAWLSFRRNGWLSAATILVMMLTLFVIGGLLLVSVIAASVLSDLEEKIDISMSFQKGTSGEAIAAIRTEVESLEGVREGTYISAEEAL